MKAAIGIFGALLLIPVFIPTGGKSEVVGFIQVACVVAAIGWIAYDLLKSPK